VTSEYSKTLHNKKDSTVTGKTFLNKRDSNATHQLIEDSKNSFNAPKIVNVVTVHDDAHPTGASVRELRLQPKYESHNFNQKPLTPQHYLHRRSRPISNIGLGQTMK
jgi:hypothetical protein